jgi:hypothetical protein
MLYQPQDFVLYGFLARLAEMNEYVIGGLAYFDFERGLFCVLSRRIRAVYVT